ncbi:HNH endonuclease [Neobacillus mesonae]|uniref:HNH endonuclease n=1 Tax=Neobacillus mesonae TaxID=1193713 RepID=UPI002E1B97E5|nr:HNH endonuclease [Neobacillus mesonae]MED4206583.1 HNH endonuclease [Neobacillus mesonae]
MAMLKICRCGKTISVSLKRCEKCAATYDSERHKLYDKHRRDKESAAFYNSKPWKVCSNRIRMRDHYMCQLCLTDKKIKPVDFVHHIKELRDVPKLSLTESNLISLCAGCHRRVHVEYDKGKQQRKAMEEVLFGILNQRV